MSDRSRRPGPVEHVVRVVPEGRVVYGMQLPIQAQSRIFVAPWETRAGPEELALVARAADESGFFYLGVCDHTAIPERLASAMGTVWYDTTASLGWLAGLTRRTRLLSHVLNLAQRHPLRAAKELCTIDALSAGRLIAGVGAGHVAEEYALFANDFEARGPRTDEAVVALARSMSEEFPTLEGPHWHVSGMGVAPRAVQHPRPPIWIGGSTRPALRRTAAFGDGWLPQGTPRAELPGQIAELRRWREELRHAAPIDIGTIAEPLYLVGQGSGGDEKWELPPPVLRGSPDKIATSLRELAAMGVNHLQVRVMARSVGECCEQIRAFGELVGPLLNA